MLSNTPRAATAALLAALAAPALAQVTVTEFPVPTAASRPYTIVAGPDGNMWFTESNGNKIASISMSGDIREFPVPTAQSGPYGIAVGPDGNLWFTERFGNAIARFDPETEQLTEFPIPTPLAQPWEIAPGADGNLWFTEEDVNQIGRISPLGVIHEFVPPSCCFPTGIAPGADGRMWFTLEIGDQIGRVEHSGAITMFPIGGTQVLPWDITPGPDGALWFTELAGRAIGRITTTGQVTEHPIAGPFSGIAGVATGPDGNLWFTENDTHNVGAIDSSGALLELEDTGERPLSIALGPDGNLWFTMADENAIGRVNRAQPGEAHVLVMDSAFVPRLRAVALGESVQWTFLGPREHSVEDASGLALFDSGPRSIVSYYVLTAGAAGTFVYRDGVHSVPNGAITVPVDLPASASAGVPFVVRWARVAPPAGVAFDIEVREPSSSTYVPWKTSRRQRASYVAATPGTYRFRARMRDVATGSATLFSRPASVHVH